MFLESMSLSLNAVAGCYARKGNPPERRSWSERWNLCRMLQSCYGSLQRLQIHGKGFFLKPHPPSPKKKVLLCSAGATVQHTTFQALCNQLVQCQRLRALTISIKCGHLGDASMDDLGAAIPRMCSVRRLVVDVPMNSITITDTHSVSLCAGVRCRCHRFMTQMTTATALEDLVVNVSGNWIRGVERDGTCGCRYGCDYGKELSKVAYIPKLQHLSMTFGGWGVRKRFGMEDAPRFQPGRRCRH